MFLNGVCVYEEKKNTENNTIHTNDGNKNNVCHYTLNVKHTHTHTRNVHVVCECVWHETAKQTFMILVIIIIISGYREKFFLGKGKSNYYNMCVC